jgi:hypothetical protein
MDPWELHEMYPTLDIKDTLGYLNKTPPKYDKNIPRINGDTCVFIPHVLSLVRYVSMFEGRHEDLLIRSFLLSLGKKKKDWVKHSWSPKSNPSLKIFVEEFLKGLGPKS